MADKRLFICFAIEDEQYRDLLKGQALNVKVSFSYTDMSVKEPWDDKWKTRCRTRIKGCDGVIALISKHTRNADGAKWEMQCANEEGVRMIGVHIHKDSTTRTFRIQNPQPRHPKSVTFHRNSLEKPTNLDILSCAQT